VLLGGALDEGGITPPGAIDAALGMPAAEASTLLSRKRWRDGDVAMPEAAAARLALPKILRSPSASGMPGTLPRWVLPMPKTTERAPG
jgi:hypothetical protein